MKLNAFDYFVIICVAGFGLRGLLRGMMKELFTLGGTVAGILLAKMFGTQLGVMLLGAAPSPTEQIVRTAAGFAIIFIATMIVAQVLARMTRKILKFGGFGWADRALGMLLGVFIGVVIPGLLLYVIIAIKGDFKGTIFQHAALTPYIVKMIKLLF